MVKNPLASAADSNSIPGLGRCIGKGNGNPLQYSCLGNPMDRGARWATVHGVAKELDMTATKTATIFLYIYYSFTYLFAYILIWLCWVLVVACGIFQSWHVNS